MNPTFILPAPPPSSRARSLIAALAVAAWLGSVCPTTALGQDDFYFGGGTRTWSNTLSWWQNYQATLQALSAPGAADTAVFNVSGQTSAGVAVLANDTSVNRLLTLTTATGGLTIRSDGTTRSLTLGPGGIRVQAGSLVLGGTTKATGVRPIDA